MAGQACCGMGVGALSHWLEEANIAGRGLLQIINEPKKQWTVVASPIHIGDVDGISAPRRGGLLREVPSNSKPAQLRRDSVSLPCMCVNISCSRCSQAMVCFDGIRILQTTADGQ